jgi:Flp pilus assembly protein TadG
VRPRLEGNRSEVGSASILVVAMLGALLVLALGVTDVAKVLRVAADAQTAADMAALSVAQEQAFPSGLDPEGIAREYAERNGAAIVSCDCSAGAFAAAVTVRVEVGALALLPDDRVVQATARAVVDLPG